jgi:hypothetical protein
VFANDVKFTVVVGHELVTEVAFIAGAIVPAAQELQYVLLTFIASNSKRLAPPKSVPTIFIEL